MRYFSTNNNNNNNQIITQEDESIALKNIAIDYFEKIPV